MIEKINRLIDKIGVYLLASGVSVLNISIAFDHVVWGDEAYSQMAIINCDLYGIFQRIYYWDSHPPLYYYYLRFFADVFGYKTSVYHIASLVPFLIGIVLACTLIKKHLGSIPAAFLSLSADYLPAAVSIILKSECIHWCLCSYFFAPIVHFGFLRMEPEFRSSC